MEKQEQDCLPATSLGIKTRKTLKEASSNNTHQPIREWYRSYEAESGICHGQQTGMGQTYKIGAGAPDRNRQIHSGFPLSHVSLN